MIDLSSHLEGKTIDDKWVVREKRIKDSQDNSGAFSSGYIVAHKETNERYFLKAFNLRYALSIHPGKKVMDVMREMTENYKFEEELGQECAGKNLDRVVAPVDSGEYSEDGYFPVPYLVFQMASKGSLKKISVSTGDLELRWKLIVLHGAFLAVSQLHRVNIAHQDIKQSNILIFGEEYASISDLGCAKRKGSDRGREHGDLAFAPVELLYLHDSDDFDIKRKGGDLYMLGLLFAKTIADIDFLSSVMSKLYPQFRPAFCNGGFRGDFRDVIPHLMQASQEVLSEIIKQIHSSLQEDSKKIISELCHPDPAMRGCPQNLLSSEPRLSLRRYISMLGNMVHKAKFI